jgi:hypothetical protein
VKVAEKLSDFAKQLAGAKTALVNLHGLDTQLRDAHAAALLQGDRMRNLPPPIDEVLANAERLIDARAAEWAAKNHHEIVWTLGGQIEAQRDGRDELRSASLPQFLTFREIKGEALVGLFPELLKARLRAIVRTIPYEAGAPLADRPRLLAEQDARIREIEDEHAALVDLAATLDPPVRLQFFPAVQARRDADADRLRREQIAQEQRERLEAEINARAEAERGRPRTVRSQYLERNRNPYK